jgi:hypothetical protein
MDNTNAERHARFRARRTQAAQEVADRLRVLEGENAELRNAFAAAKTAAAALRNAVSGQDIQLDWEILVDDEGDGFITASVEVYDLYVHQDVSTFIWFVAEDDADADAASVARGEAPSLVAAMAAAEAAVRRQGSRDDCKPVLSERETAKLEVEAKLLIDTPPSRLQNIIGMAPLNK